MGERTRVSHLRRRALGAFVAVLVCTGLLFQVGSGQAREGASPTPRVIGGSNADIADWPWQIALLQDFGAGKLRQICGGSLLAPNVVVTAAHCVYSPGAGFAEPASYRVLSGQSKLSASDGQLLEIQEIHAFKKPNGQVRYNPRKNKWDAVLLKLAEPSTSTPVKIAGPDEEALWEGGRDAWVTGWGAIKKNGRKSPDTLQEVKVRINNEAHCGSVYEDTYDDRLMICAGGGQPARDACLGDSGGPLVAPMDGGGFRLIGATSFGGSRCGGGAVWVHLASDPMRSAIQDEVLALSGVDPIGSGAVAVPGTLPPTPLTALLARVRAEGYLFVHCRRNCFGPGVKSCKKRGKGFNCVVRRLIFKKKRDIVQTRKVRITQKQDGTVNAKPKGKWKQAR